MQGSQNGLTDLFDNGSFKNKVKLTLSNLSGAFMLPISVMAITGMFLSVGSFMEGKGPQLGWVEFSGRIIKSVAKPIYSALPLIFCIAFLSSFSKGNIVVIFSGIIAYLTFLCIQHECLRFSTNLSWNNYIQNYLIGTNLGMKSFETSIFGPMAVSGVVLFISRNYSNVKLPQLITFFSGERLVPLLCAVTMIPLAMCFVCLWLFIGYGIQCAGGGMASFFSSSKMMPGVDSFLYGWIERMLVPLGLHHVFYSLLWYTPLGGSVSYVLNDGSGGLSRSEILNTTFGSWEGWQGDSFIGLSSLSFPKNTVDNTPLFEYFAKKNLNVGRFTGGKYPIMQFGLPAAAFAMYAATPKQQRRGTLKALIPASASSFFMGITEPIEFIFLFSAPLLFYGFHALMCGFSFLAMNLLGTHIPMAFSGGFIEFIFMGIIPWEKGTNFIWWLAVGGVIAPIYFSVFFLWIKVKGLVIPGAGSAQENTTRYLIPEPIRGLAIGLGGWDNVNKFSNCASRLRIDIANKELIDEERLKEAGAIAIKFVGDSHIQVILGPKAAQINVSLLEWRGTDLDAVKNE